MPDLLASVIDVSLIISPRISSTTTCRALGLFALGLTGCLEHPVRPVAISRNTPVLEYVNLEEKRDVDVLLVVDNSASMGEEQRALSRNFAAFVDVLESPDVRANYRLGVTTTDMGAGNVPGCRTPDNGALKLESCMERSDAFVDVARTVNRFNTACRSICDLNKEQLEIRPTRVEHEDAARPRSWLERIDGRSNLADPKLSVADAFRCFGPQGISGCGFESQLESMYQALVAGSSETVDPKHPNFGFLRDDALLAVVHVSDELDCSLNPSHALYGAGESELYHRVLGRESQAFWGEEQSGATSANCFRAGVHCSGADGGNYEACVAQDRNVKAEPTEDPTQAVLSPVERYIDGVREIANAKSSAGAGDVIVGVIGGVQEDGQVVYPRADSPRDAELRRSFGLGAGCQAETEFLPEQHPKNSELTLEGGSEIGIALPPVRMAAFASAFSDEAPRGLYRICQEDLTGPLRSIAKTIQTKLRPSCYFGCVRDSRPDLDQMVPDCTVALSDGESDQFQPIAECQREKSEDPSSPYRFDESAGKYEIPEGEDLCFVQRTDVDGEQTADPHDNLAAFCREQKRNVELFVEYREGVVRSKKAKVVVSCNLSENAALDCADL